MAVARLSDESRVAEISAESLPAGSVSCAVDDEDALSGLYALPGVPVSILIYQGVEVDRWIGQAPSGAWQQSLEDLLAEITPSG